MQLDLFSRFSFKAVSSIFLCFIISACVSYESNIQYSSDHKSFNSIRTKLKSAEFSGNIVYKDKKNSKNNFSASIKYKYSNNSDYHIVINSFLIKPIELKKINNTISIRNNNIDSYYSSSKPSEDIMEDLFRVKLPIDSLFFLISAQRIPDSKNIELINNNLVKQKVSNIELSYSKFFIKKENYLFPQEIKISNSLAEIYINIKSLDLNYK